MQKDAVIRKPTPILADTEARCRPSQYCPHKEHCARFRAPIQTHHASIQDYSLGMALMFGCAAKLPMPESAK